MPHERCSLMRVMSAAMQAALQGSHAATTLVEVFNNSGTLLAELTDAVDGSVTVERAAIERRADISFVDVEGQISPTEATSLLAPYGNALRISRGIRYPDGTAELVPLVTGRIARAAGSYPNLGVSLYDYGYVVQRARLEFPYGIASGTNFITAIQELLVNRFPTIQTNFPTTPLVTPLILIDEQDDPWDAATKMAEAIGMRLFFDGLGVCQLINETAAETTPAWFYQEGDTALIVALDRDLDTEQSYNAVVVVGETTENDQPVRAVAYDNDSTSPTQWGGNYGKAPMFYQSGLVLSVDQAQDAANAMLLKQLGMTERLAITGICNPAHEIGDVLAVRRAASGVDANHVLDNIQIPLKGATASMQTRARQVLA